MTSDSLSRPLNHRLDPQPLLTIQVPQVETESEELRIKDYRYIGSYNWAQGSDEKNPIILVPGSPPEWLERPLPITVPPDTGTHFRDRNGHNLPGRPLLPLVAAVTEQKVQPPLDWKTVDIVTDRNSLRKLLRWVRGTGRDWRIDTELVGAKTVFLNRWEQQTIDQLHGTTYGFGFENATTKTTLESEVVPGHARIVTYDYGGLKLALQFEVDAYLPSTSSPPTATEIPSKTIPDVNLSQVDVEKCFSLGVIREGNGDVPDSAIIELATTTRKLDWKERYPQLFFSQTPHHFLAWHDQLRMGTFTRIDRRSLDCPLLQAANARLQPAFKKLRATLELIRKIIVEHGPDVRLTLLCINKRLEVYKRDDQRSCLTEDALALFNDEI